MVDRFKSYPEYKDSFLNYYGLIPKHWCLEKIKYNSYVKGRQGWQNLRADEYQDEGPYLVTGAHFNKGGQVDWSRCHHISEERYERDSAIWIQDQDVLITKDGTIGKVAYITDMPDKACLNSHLLIIRSLKGRYNQRYLYHLLVSEAFKAFIPTRQTGTTFMGITQEAIEEYPLILPSKQEQEKIAKFLDYETAKIDTLIEKQQRLIELLTEKRQAVISHAVTKGLNPDAPMKDSGVEWLGEVPEHWELVPLKYLCRFSGGGTPTKDNLSYWTNGTIPWVSPKDMKSFWISKTQDYITEIAVKESSTNLVETGTLLMVVRSGILQRTIPIAINTVPVTLNQDMKALSFNSRISAEYVANYIHGNVQQLLLEWSKEGATVESIEHEYLSNSLVPIPPKNEQNLIVDSLNKQMQVFSNLSAKAQRAIQLMQERRTALISAAVTGKIDVRDWVKPE